MKNIQKSPKEYVSEKPNFNERLVVLKNPATEEKTTCTTMPEPSIETNQFEVKVFLERDKQPKPARHDFH